MDTSLKLINDETLCLCDNENNIIAQQIPRWTKFEQFKRVKENCHIIKESNENFPKDIKDKANIYCLDNNFKIKWTIDAPFENDFFPNPIIWDKEIVRGKKDNGPLASNVVDNCDTFICSSWNGFTVTVEYETGRTIAKEFTK